MGLRNLFLRFLSPARRAAMEAESRAWKATCPNCGRKTSIWDLGGIRYKAVGKPLTGLRCAGCGKFRMHRIAKE